MRRQSFKIKKGGIDTIVAYIVVMLPLLYVVVYMVATIYHFSVQTYMNQVVKEATMMASTYGEITTGHYNYIHEKLKGILGTDEHDSGKANCTIKCYLKNFDESTGTMGKLADYSKQDVNKADIIGIYVVSEKVSILESVSSFNLFDPNKEPDEGALRYSAYKEEIVRNDKPGT